MIKKLQHRFIIITMAGVVSIFLLILIVLNISVNYSATKRGYDLLLQHSQRPEEKMPGRKWFDDMRILYVVYDKQGTLQTLSTGGNPAMTEAALTALAQKALSSADEKGRIQGYLYLLCQEDTETRIYFLDYTPEREMSMRLLWICLWVGLLGILVIFVLVLFLSRWVVRPVQLAFHKQKQFIADASHELKTPLTIITTNAEVLQSSLPGNKWLSYILEQSGRMKSLINSLLELARLDAYESGAESSFFDFSKAVQNAALSFESLAYEYHKTYTTEITEGMRLYGNETAIRQLVTILLDNAFKYSDEKGTILLKLSAQGDKKILLVHNTGNGIPKEEQKRVFERFYRSEASRNRQYGGYGLGLSIADAIVKAHKGHISLKSDGLSYTEFVVIFS